MLASSWVGLPLVIWTAAVDPAVTHVAAEGLLLSFASLFGLFASLGLDSLIVRDLTRAKGRDGEIIGSSLVLRCTAAALT